MLSTLLRHPVSMKTLLTNVRPICEITQHLRQDKNVFPMVLTVRTFLTRSIRLSGGLIQSARFFKPRKLSHQQTIKLDINTNVKNNVILYKNENHRHRRLMLYCGIAQLFGWSLLASFTYTPSFFDIFYTDIKLEKYIHEHLFRLSFFILSVFIGPFTYATLHVICSRTVKYIILHKGGKLVTFITANLWNKNRNIQVPTNMVKCVCQRSSNRNVMPLKLKNQRFYYLVEARGTFVNPELFDHTLGFSHFRNL